MLKSKNSIIPDKNIAISIPYDSGQLPYSKCTYATPFYNQLNTYLSAINNLNFLGTFEGRNLSEINKQFKDLASYYHDKFIITFGGDLSILPVILKSYLDLHQSLYLISLGHPPNNLISIYTISGSLDLSTPSFSIKQIESFRKSSTDIHIFLSKNKYQKIFFAIDVSILPQNIFHFSGHRMKQQIQIHQMEIILGDILLKHQHIGACITGISIPAQLPHDAPEPETSLLTFKNILNLLIG
ncbi:hypothetical protein OAB57_04085 [Bacteriovoracaceae bacterium]|nr:hypothetical protein [Bacteriovoracaceae bacterium]